MISYSQRQRDIADRVHDWLDAKGHSPRLDHLDIPAGDRFARTLAWWLAACHVAVVLLSEDALASPWVRYELSVLVNREREGGDVRVVLVLLDGLDMEAVASRPELAPLDLASLQAREWAGPACDLADDLIADILRGALDATTDAPIEALAGRAYDDVRDAGDDAVARARRALPEKTADERDRWRDEPTVGDLTALRWALARDICSHALSVAYPAFAELADDSNMHQRVFALVDLNVMATIDPAALRVIHGAWTGTSRPGAVVFGFTTQALADLALRAVRLVHNTPKPFLRPIVHPLTGNGASEVVDGIVGELEASLADDDEDLDSYLGDLAALGHPVVLLLTRPEGLTPEILDHLRRRLSGVNVMVLASRQLDPLEWARRLNGALVAGPQLEGAAWGDLVAMEELLLADRDRTTRTLRRVIREG